MWLELWGHLAAIFAWGGEGGGGGGGGDFEVGGIGICTLHCGANYYALRLLYLVIVATWASEICDVSIKICI